MAMKSMAADRAMHRGDACEACGDPDSEFSDFSQKKVPTRLLPGRFRAGTLPEPRAIG